MILHCRWDLITSIFFPLLSIWYKAMCSVSGEMYDMGVSRKLSGWDKPGCIISQSKSVINKSLWKAASANCLCAVSQGCLCCLAFAHFTALETCCFCCFKPITLFWEQRNICVLKQKKWWRERKRGIYGRRYGDFPHCWPPLCLRSCCLPLQKWKLQSPLTHRVTVGWVCPSRLVKQSSCVPPLHRKYSASSSIMQHVDCTLNRRVTGWFLTLNWC